MTDVFYELTCIRWWSTALLSLFFFFFFCVHSLTFLFQ